jgi:hypothetical protein
VRTWMLGSWSAPGLALVASLLLTAPAAAQTTIGIHDVQGNGGSSPILGQTVTVVGVVTAVTSDGFFLQEEDVDVDADPATSEGVFVLTSSADSSFVGCQCSVSGTVTEFVPSTKMLQPPETQITAPTAIVPGSVPAPRSQPPRSLRGQRMYFRLAPQPRAFSKTPIFDRREGAQLSTGLDSAVACCPRSAGLWDERRDVARHKKGWTELVGRRAGRHGFPRLVRGGGDSRRLWGLRFRDGDRGVVPPPCTAWRCVTSGGSAASAR